MAFWKFIFRLGKKNSEQPNDMTVHQAAPLSVCDAHKSFARLRQEGNVFYFTQRKQFHQDGVLKPATVQTVFEFAYGMTFGDEGRHRDHRSGGTHARKNGEIFANTFQGKIAECAACNYFFRFDKSITPDFSKFKLGKWDSGDLSVCGNEIAIKSTKNYGQLLLLEESDWDQNGEYIPGKEDNNSSYNYVVMIRLKSSCEDLLKRNKLLYSSSAQKTDLEKLILSQKWEYELTGFITKADLKFIIGERYILPKDSILNETTEMDADNYYVQVADLREMTTWEEHSRGEADG